MPPACLLTGSVINESHDVKRTLGDLRVSRIDVSGKSQADVVNGLLLEWMPDQVLIDGQPNSVWFDLARSYASRGCHHRLQELVSHSHSGGPKHKEIEVTNTSQAISVRIAKHLAGTVGQHRFNMWFDRSAKLRYDSRDRRLNVAVPNQFVLDWIDRNFRDELQQSALAEVGEVVAIDIHIDAGKFIGQFVHPPQGDAGSNLAADTNAAATEFNAATGGHRKRGARRGASAKGQADQADLAGQADQPGNTRRAQPGTGAQGWSSQRQPGTRRGVRAGQLRYRFEDFVVGPSNELAYNAALQLVEDEHSPTNPLFIHGGVGLGKTHLLQAVCAKVRELQPDARVTYTTGEQFTNDFLTAMRDRKLDQFRRRIRRLDVLAIDDVHFLAGKEKSQQEFLHCFDEIDLSGARVVLASDNHPKQIKKFNLALVSRCMRGLVAEVFPPDVSVRMRILTALAERRGLTMYETVAAALAQRCHGSIREMEGVLAKLDALSRIPSSTYTDGRDAQLVSDGQSSPTQLGDDPKDGHTDDANSTTRGTDAPRVPSRTIGHALVNKLFETENRRPRKPISFEAILKNVSDVLQISRAEILSSKRVKHVVLARSIAIYLARQLTSMSYPEITDAMNRSSHSTVIAADQRIKGQIKDALPVKMPAMLEATPLAEVVENLKRRIMDQA